MVTCMALSHHMHTISVPQDEHWLSLIQYGYQTWCSSILSETLRSFHVKSDQLQSVADKSSDNTIYSVREILGHATQLLYQITEVQV